MLFFDFAETEPAFSEGDDSEHSCVIGSEIYLDVSYLHYLYDARSSISSCMRACRVWSAPYDGQDPPPEEYHPSTLEEGVQVCPTTAPQRASKNLQGHAQVNPKALNDLTVSLGLELEWDDSYDAVPPQAQPEEEQETPVAIPDDPPEHIQELRKTAIMIVKGSYIEESEFQNDVMVYDLVAQKDAQDSAKSKPNRVKIQPDVEKQIKLIHSSESGSPTDKPKICNGLSISQKSTDMENHSKDSDGALKSLEGDDLVTQYEQLIQTLVAEAKSPTKSHSEFRSPVVPMEEEEDEVDFSLFSAETPEAEKIPSPFGSKPRSSSRNHAIPFTGEIINII